VHGVVKEEEPENEEETKRQYATENERQVSEVYLGLSVRPEVMVMIRRYMGRFERVRRLRVVVVPNRADEKPGLSTRLGKQARSRAAESLVF